MLFSVRQKHQDLLTQLAVSVQGYLALDVIRRNNLELIKGVDRATTTTVSALRTAVIVAQALADQKLVLDQITALNTTTVEPDRVDLRDAPPAVRRRSTSRRRRRRSTSRSCRRRSPTSTRRWTRSTRSRSQALDTMQKTVDRALDARSRSRRPTSTGFARTRHRPPRSIDSGPIRSERRAGVRPDDARPRSGGALPLVDLALDVDQLLGDVRRGIADALVVDRRPELGDEEVQESLGAELAERLVELLGEVPLDRADQGRASLGDRRIRMGEAGDRWETCPDLPCGPAARLAFADGFPDAVWSVRMRRCAPQPRRNP